MERDFLAFINDNHLFPTTDQVLLAVSGGLDSMVMAALFHRAGLPFSIAHVDFGLRGPESDADALFVKNKADGYGVPFHLMRVDTTATATERGISIQMAARDLRYNWFAQLLAEHNYPCVATAHHLNDVLETLLLNLTRGTGLAGLHGIAPRQNNVVRPLLFATREQIAAYADEHGLTYREDSSNADDTYARNRIRHQVVPVLTSLNPGLWQTLPRTVEKLRAAETLMQRDLDRAWQATVVQTGNQILLPTAKLLALPEPLFQLSEWLNPFGFVADQIARMLACLHQPVGQVFNSATHRVTHERDGLLLEPLPQSVDYEITLTHWPNAPVPLPNGGTLTMQVMEKPDAFKPLPNPAVACFDADRLTFPLTIRPWQQGDRFRPLGMNGRKLVSDLLNDLKVGRTEREQTAVLLANGEVAWVIGYRIGHPFRVRVETERIVKIEFIKDQP